MNNTIIEWIDIKEKKPNEGDYVFIKTSKGLLGLASYVPSKPCLGCNFIVDGIELKHFPVRITHWCTIPEDPKI